MNLSAAPFAGLDGIVPADSKLIKLADGLKFIEGPVWTDADGGYLVFSDIDGNKQFKWSESGGIQIFRDPSDKSNGNFRDRQGRLVSCEHWTRRVVRREGDGSLTILADQFEGKPLNSPNDVVVKSDGAIYFTDPWYGLEGRKQEQPGCFVYRIDPVSNKLAVVARDFDCPNGLCFTPDEKKLYIDDSGKPHHVCLFNVNPDGTLTGSKIFCVIDKGVPDGIRCDSQGRLFATSADSIQIFNPDGKLLGKIPVPMTPANCCFGGPDNRSLFITAHTTLYKIHLSVSGAVAPPK